jgi:hypothetical protein
VFANVRERLGEREQQLPPVLLGQGCPVGRQTPHRRECRVADREPLAVGEVAVEPATPGRQRDRVFERTARLVEAPDLLQGDAHVAMATGVPRAQGDRPLVLRDRLVMTVERLQREAEIVMCRGKVRPDGKRALVMRDRLGGAVGRMQREPKIVVGAGIFRIEGERFLMTGDRRFMAPQQL